MLDPLLAARKLLMRIWMQLLRWHDVLMDRATVMVSRVDGNGRAPSPASTGDSGLALMDPEAVVLISHMDHLYIWRVMPSILLSMKCPVLTQYEAYNFDYLSRRH